MSIKEVTDSFFLNELENQPLPVIADLWAPWCAPCLAGLPRLQRAADKYGDEILFVKINTDESELIKSILNIMSLPTLIVFNRGSEIFRVSGLSPESIRSAIEAAQKAYQPHLPSDVVVWDGHNRDQLISSLLIQQDGLKKANEELSHILSSVLDNKDAEGFISGIFNNAGNIASNNHYESFIRLMPEKLDLTVFYLRFITTSFDDCADYVRYLTNGVISKKSCFHDFINLMSDIHLAGIDDFRGKIEEIKTLSRVDQLVDSEAERALIVATLTALLNPNIQNLVNYVRIFSEFNYSFIHERLEKTNELQEMNREISVALRSLGGSPSDPVEQAKYHKNQNLIFEGHREKFQKTYPKIWSQYNRIMQQGKAASNAITVQLPYSILTSLLYFK